MADSKVKLSFGFNKKVGHRNLQDSKLREDGTKEVKSDPDYVLSLSGKQIESSIPIAKKTKLVIPLIVKNNWRLPSNAIGSNVRSDEGASVLDTQAIEEIIKDAKRLKDGPTEDDKKLSNMVIPVFMQNRIPEGFETDEKVDVALRAEESTLNDYERVPIEEYGAAMLRGMGWKPNEGIGTTNKKVVDAPEPVLRPKGLGLGADPKVKQSSNSKNKDENVPSIGVGVYVKVVKGPQEGLYGQIQGLDTDNARVIVRLTISSKTITISEYLIQAVSKQEHKKEGKILNKAKYDEYKAKSDEALLKSRSRDEDERRGETSSRSHRDRNDDRKLNKDARGSKRRHSPDGRGSTHKGSNEAPASWVQPMLRVRFIDKSYKGGKYYNSKVVIEDVVNSGLCICRTDGGTILEEVSEKWLETLIPKKSPPIVMVVKGGHKRQLGEILDKDRRKCTATVQLLQDKDVVQLGYDSICEYCGKVSDEY